jgi:hypothetical protein
VADAVGVATAGRDGLSRQWPARSARLTYSDTVPTPTPHARAIARWRRPCSCLSRRISRIFRIGSRSAPIQVPSSRGPRLQQLRYRRVITIAGIPDQDPGIADHDARNR